MNARRLGATAVVGLALLMPVAQPLDQSAAAQAVPALDAPEPWVKHLGTLDVAAYATDPVPDGLSAQQRAAYILTERPMLGRTPAAWLALAHSFEVSEPSAVVAPSASLEDAISQAYAAVGVSPTPADLRAARANAALVPPALQAPVADLLAAVAAAYAEQAAAAQLVGERYALDRPVNEPLLPFEERDAMIERASGLVEALATFKARLEAIGGPAAASPKASCLVPVASSCLAYLGGNGDDVYLRNTAPFPDPILVVDPAGDDTYRNSAGGANPLGLFVPGGGAGGGNGIALSVVADYTGNDVYAWDGAPSNVQGAGAPGGLGILVDYEGTDTYFARFTRTTVPPRASVFPGYYQDGGAQGFGYAGFGLLLDGWGHDTYDMRVKSTQGHCIWALNQGWGGEGGVGIVSDLWGDDDWLTSGEGLTGVNDCFGFGNGVAPEDDAFIGVYPQGAGFLLGVGILTDTGRGADYYAVYDNATVVDFYAQGFGAFGGLGILYEDGGNDVYIAEEHATASWINPTLNCAYGTASLGGVGIMIDEAGDDVYYADTTSDKGATTMIQGAGDVGAGYGLFIDGSGADRHEAYASSSGTGGVVGVFGRGVLDTRYFAYNVWGTFVDLGGQENVYIPIIGVFPWGPATNHNAWIGGVSQ